jgi:hypothetical protein
MMSLHITTVFTHLIRTEEWIIDICQMIWTFRVPHHTNEMEDPATPWIVSGDPTSRAISRS